MLEEVYYKTAMKKSRFTGSRLRAKWERGKLFHYEFIIEGHTVNNEMDVTTLHPLMDTVRRN
jgi:hypothetical protein